MKTPIEFLAEIYAWLCFNTNPNKEQIQDLKNDIDKYLLDKAKEKELMKKYVSHADKQYFTVGYEQYLNSIGIPYEEIRRMEKRENGE
jgi:hypothetical protein